MSGNKNIARVGFACVTYSLGLTTNHNFRLANLGRERLEEAVSRNLDDLEAILSWMVQTELRLFRIGSSFVPFASHRAMSLDWKSACAARLGRIGRKYAALGFRFSMHPGQYNVLNSPSPEVFAGTVAELAYSCDILDLMELDGSHKVLIHAGGVYGDKARSLERLTGAVDALPVSIKARLALENDDRRFTFEEIVGVSVRTGVPAVYDHHHQQLNPSGRVRGLLGRARPIWGESAPEVHLSSQKPGARPGAHDLSVRESDLRELLELLPFQVDLMVEAKAKEVAALEVLRMLRGMDGPVPKP